MYIIYHLATHKYAGLSSLNKFISLWSVNYWPMITFCLSIIGMFFPMVLITFHCYLIATGQTTNEKAKNAFNFVSPYSRGCCLNIWENICVISVPISNVHIHHQPPNKEQNEAIVNKRKIVYISSEDTKQTISNNLHGNKFNNNSMSDPTDHEQQKLLNSKHRNKHKHKRQRQRDHGHGHDCEHEDDIKHVDRSDVIEIADDDPTTQCQILPHSKCSHSNDSDQCNRPHLEQHHSDNNNNNIIEEEEENIHIARYNHDYKDEEEEKLHLENMMSSHNDSSMDNHDPTPSSNIQCVDQRNSNKRTANKISLNPMQTVARYNSSELNITAHPSSHEDDDHEEEYDEHDDHDESHQYYLSQQDRYNKYKVKVKKKSMNKNKIRNKIKNKTKTKNTKIYKIVNKNMSSSKSKTSSHGPSIHHQNLESASEDTRSTLPMGMTYTQPVVYTKPASGFTAKLNENERIKQVEDIEKQIKNINMVLNICIMMVIQQ